MIRNFEWYGDVSLECLFSLQDGQFLHDDVIRILEVLRGGGEERARAMASFLRRLDTVPGSPVGMGVLVNYLDGLDHSGLIQALKNMIEEFSRRQDCSYIEIIENMCQELKARVLADSGDTSMSSLHVRANYYPDQHYTTIFNAVTGAFARIEDTEYLQPDWAWHGPELLDVSLTSRCDRHCTSCYRSALSSGSDQR